MVTILLATGKQKGSAGIKLTWLKWKGASGYEVYWFYCDGKKKLLSHAAKLRYYTDDKKVAKVSRTGKITAKGRGKCTVYVTANNGVCKKIKVTVK